MRAEVLSVITLTWHQTWFVQTKSHQIIARRKDSDFVEQPGCAQFSPINPPEIYRPQRRAVSHAIATSIHHVIKRKIGYYIRRLSHFMIDSFWIDQRVLCGGTYRTFHALTLSRLTGAGTINMDVPFKLRWRPLNEFLHDFSRYSATWHYRFIVLVIFSSALLKWNFQCEKERLPRISDYREDTRNPVIRAKVDSKIFCSLSLALRGDCSFKYAF